MAQSIVARNPKKVLIIRAHPCKSAENNLICKNP
jgi:hypothetical protein